MHVLAMIFGWTALLGTIFVGANWVNARSEASKAGSGYELAQARIETLEGLRTSEQQLEDSIIRNLNEGVGGKTGAKTLRSEAATNIAEMRDTLSRLSEEQDIAAANRNSLSVYSAVVDRDIHLAYVLGALWLAFGFAWALAPKRAKPAQVI